MNPRTFKLLRASHRWAGLFFAPLILLFAFTGLLQTLHAGDWPMPQWLADVYYALEDAHQHQRLRRGAAMQQLAVAAVVVMAGVLILTTLLGVVMAYVMHPRRRVLITLILLAGVAIPALVLLL